MKNVFFVSGRFLDHPHPSHDNPAPPRFCHRRRVRAGTNAPSSVVRGVTAISGVQNMSTPRPRVPFPPRSKRFLGTKPGGELQGHHLLPGAAPSQARQAAGGAYPQPGPQSRGSPAEESGEPASRDRLPQVGAEGKNEGAHRQRRAGGLTSIQGGRLKQRQQLDKIKSSLHPEGVPPYRRQGQRQGHAEARDRLTRPGEKLSMDLL